MDIPGLSHGGIFFMSYELKIFECKGAKDGK